MTKNQSRLRKLANYVSEIAKKAFSSKVILTVFIAIIAVQFILPGTAFATEDNTTLKGIAEIAGVIINIITFISLLMMNFFGKLLGTDLLTGPAAMQAITPMWVWVRNITNILFVMVLVGLAFTNLYSSFSKEGGGNWTIKDKLPKVIIALVAINFSLLGFKVVIDAINVGTVAILGIADSRLDADNSNLQGAMLKQKTWMIVNKGMYDKFNEKGNIVKPSKSIEEIRGGDSCTKLHNNDFKNKEDSNKILGFTAPNSEGKTRYFICRDFRSSVNDLFCGNWETIAKENGVEKEDIDQSELTDDCLFILKENKFKTMIDPDDEPGQNLFMSFGTTFVHLERLPALGAEINSLNGVIMNTLFSAIIGLAYLVALIAVFIALIARMVVIWIALVFSPLLIAASIMGFDQGEGGKIADELVTHLIMPLKIAAAFAVSFVMMSAMIDFNIVGKNEAFVFGPALSHLGIGEFGFLWQIATIVIFWMAAKWAVEGSLAKDITGKIFTGAETLGEVAARAATVDRQIFSIGTGKNDPKFSMSNILSMPAAVSQYRQSKQAEGLSNMKTALGLTQSEMDKKIAAKSFGGSDTMDDFMNFIKQFKSRAELEAHAAQIKAMLDRSTAVFAEKLSKHIDSEGIIKGVNNYAISGRGKQQFKNQHGGGYTDKFIERQGFYQGPDYSPETGKPDTEKAKENDKIEGAEVEGKRVYKFSDAGGNAESITPSEIVDTANTTNLKGTNWTTEKVMDVVEKSGKNLSEVLAGLIAKGATVAGLESIEEAEGTGAKILSGKDGSGTQHVQLIDEQTGVRLNPGESITKDNAQQTFETTINNYNSLSNEDKKKTDNTIVKEYNIIKNNASAIENKLGLTKKALSGLFSAT